MLWIGYFAILCFGTAQNRKYGPNQFGPGIPAELWWESGFEDISRLNIDGWTGVEMVMEGVMICGSRHFGAESRVQFRENGHLRFVHESRWSVKGNWPTADF